jgi:hypothetical protein
MDEEKDTPAPRVIENLSDLHEFNEREGYVITDTEHSDLKRAHDGKTILLPQPGSDQNDPLNWSWMKKHTILIIVSMTAFLPDYGSATGAVSKLGFSRACVHILTSPQHFFHKLRSGA